MISSLPTPYCAIVPIVIRATTYNRVRIRVGEYKGRLSVCRTAGRNAQKTPCNTHSTIHGTIRQRVARDRGIRSNDSRRDDTHVRLFSFPTYPYIRMDRLRK